MDPVPASCPRPTSARGARSGSSTPGTKAARVIPNKVFQALACARPVITADTPAARELLTDDVDALLVPPGDPEALGQRRAAGSPATAELAGRLAERGPGDVRGARLRGGAGRALARAPRAGRAAPDEAAVEPRRRRDRRVRRRASRARRPAAPGVLDGPLRRRQPRPGGLVDGARRRPLRHRAHGAQQISRLGAHFDPLVAAFAPLWWLWPDPSLLLVCQAAAVATGAVPVYLLGRRHLESDWAAAGLRARLPPASGDAVARPRRLPSGRARDAAAPVGVLVPRQRAARAVRGSPRVRRA